MCMGFVLFFSERAAHHQKSSRELRSQRSYENQALLKHWCMEMVRKDSRNPAEHSWAIMTISSLCGRVWLQEQIMGRGQVARHAEPLKEWARVKRNWVAFNIALVLGSTKNNSKSFHYSCLPPVFIITIGGVSSTNFIFIIHKSSCSAWCLANLSVSAQRHKLMAVKYGISECVHSVKRGLYCICKWTGDTWDKKHVCLEKSCFR